MLLRGQRGPLGAQGPQRAGDEHPGLGRGGGGGWRLNLAPTPELLARVARLRPIRDVATVIGDSSSAFSGASPSDPGSLDQAAVLFDNGANANATGGDYLYDIITALGNESGAAAATSGSSFLSELASLF